jgi:hypothetical protein
MIGLPAGTKVFLACQPIDLRAGFDGLAAKVQRWPQGFVCPACGGGRSVVEEPGAHLRMP